MRAAALHPELLSDKIHLLSDNICRFHTWFFFFQTSFNSFSHKQFFILWQKNFFLWYFFYSVSHTLIFYSWQKTKHFRSYKTKISSEIFRWDSNLEEISPQIALGPFHTHGFEKIHGFVCFFIPKTKFLLFFSLFHTHLFLSWRKSHMEFFFYPEMFLSYTKHL